MEDKNKTKETKLKMSTKKKIIMALLSVSILAVGGYVFQRMENNGNPQASLTEGQIEFYKRVNEQEKF